MKYPASFVPESGGYVVTFRDIPEAITQGDNDDEAMFMARDVLREAISVYFDEKRPVPLPSSQQTGERLVELPLIVTAKILLLNEMLTQNVSSAELAQRLDTLPQEVDKLIDLHELTRIDQIAEALAAMNRELGVFVA